MDDAGLAWFPASGRLLCPRLGGRRAAHRAPSQVIFGLAPVFAGACRLSGRAAGRRNFEGEGGFAVSVFRAVARAGRGHARTAGTPIGGAHAWRRGVDEDIATRRPRLLRELRSGPLERGAKLLCFGRQSPTPAQMALL